jgi:hypothetical protein
MHTTLIHSFCKPIKGALLKHTEVSCRVAKHRGEAVDSSVVEMVEKQITVTYILVHLSTFVYSVDEGPIREHLEHQYLILANKCELCALCLTIEHFVFPVA